MRTPCGPRSLAGSVRYTPSVGEKFNEDGSAKRFPGNTVVCMVPPDSDTYKALAVARDILRRGLGEAGRYAWLPESSYHMTVFDCVCDQERRVEKWTSNLPLDAPLDKVDAVLKEKWGALAKPAPFRMKFERVAVGQFITARLAPETKDEEARLRSFRDRLSREFGIRHPTHERYFFHITFAYGIVELENEDGAAVAKAKADADAHLKASFGVFPAASPILAFFNDMLSFPTDRE